jgi:hypothetical protein
MFEHDFTPSPEDVTTAGHGVPEAHPTVPTVGGDYPITNSEPRPIPSAVGVTRSQLTAEPQQLHVRASMVAGIAPEEALYAPAPAPKKAPFKAKASTTTPVGMAEIPSGATIAGGIIPPPVITLPTGEPFTPTPAPKLPRKRTPKVAAATPEESAPPVYTPPLPVADTQAPFRTAAKLYTAAGWPVIPVNPANKRPAAAGCTGRRGVDADDAVIDGWINTHGECNIGIRMPEGFIAIDIDDYDGKPGAASIDSCIATGLSPLPVTIRTTSRSGKSGKYFYRVPAGIEFHEAAIKRAAGLSPEQNSGVEILQRHHRHAQCWPSINPQTGAREQWLRGREALKGLPLRSDAAELPADWIEFLRKPARAKTPPKPGSDTGSTAADAGNPDVFPAIVRALTAGEPTKPLAQQVSKILTAIAGGASRWNSIRDGQVSILGYGIRGHAGAAAAIESLRGDFCTQYPDHQFARLLWSQSVEDRTADEERRHAAAESQRAAQEVSDLLSIAGNNDAGEVPVAQPTTVHGEWIYTLKEADAAGWPRLPTVNAQGAKVHNWDNTDIYPLGHPYAPDLVEKLANFSDVTRFWLWYSREFRSPVGWIAAYFTYLIRLGLRLPTTFTLDATTPTLHIMRYGQAGGAKSSSVVCAKSVPMADPPWYRAKYPSFLAEDGPPRWDHHHTLGSGEVLIELLTEKNADGQRVWKRHATTWIEEAESEAFFRRASAGNSTIIPELNKTWAGERPGTSTKTSGFDEIPDGPFNVYWSGAIQDTVWPKFAHELSGFRQRGTLCSSDDLWSPYPCNVPKPPAGYTPPGLPELPAADQLGRHGFTYCAAVKEATEALKASTGLIPVEAVDGSNTHRLWNRKRVAAHVALSMGTTHIDDAIWEHTGYLMEHHDRVAAVANAAGERANEIEDLGKGRRLASVDTGRAVAHHDASAQAAEKIVEAVERGPARKEDVRNSLTSRARSKFPEALERLVTAKIIEEFKEGRRVLISRGPSY